MTVRNASATWEGDLLHGNGQFTLDSSGATGSLPVSWPARAEQPDGKTSPEELIAAAHATCFSMALSNELAKAGATPRRIETSAAVTFDTSGGGARISTVALRVRAQVDGVDDDGFRRAAEGAKDGCPVSQALRGNVELTLDAALA